MTSSWTFAPVTRTARIATTAASISASVAMEAPFSRGSVAGAYPLRDNPFQSHLADMVRTKSPRFVGRSFGSTHFFWHDPHVRAVAYPERPAVSGCGFYRSRSGRLGSPFLRQTGPRKCSAVVTFSFLPDIH